jgi:hypothetical protein
MKTKILPEYLGDISTELLLQNLTNTNPHVSKINWLRELVPDGFTVSVEYELPTAENEMDMNQLQSEAEKRIKPNNPETWDPKPTKLIRLVLMAKEKADAVAS